ncbi:MAG: pentapeptide repeat-containing protein [Myxococcota bacterium]
MAELPKPHDGMTPEEKGELLKRYVATGERFFWGLDFNYADLTGAHLSRADLSRADLRGANLIGADLGGANLVEANLKGAGFFGAKLAGAIVRAVDLGTTNLLSGADLSRLNLEGITLAGVDLTSTQFRGTNLRKADLSNSILRDTNMVGADLRGTNLSQAKLDRANFRTADLRGANLRWASISDVRWNGARIDSATQVSSGWTQEFITDLHDQGVLLDSLLLAHVLRPGLTLYFRTQLDELDEAAILVVLRDFKAKFPGSDVRKTLFENTGERAKLRIESSNEDHLAILAELLQNRAWEQSSEPADSAVPLSLEGRAYAWAGDQLSVIMDRTGRMEIWRQQDDKVVLVRTLEPTTSPAREHANFLIETFEKDELKRFVKSVNVQLAAKVNWDSTMESVAHDVVEALRRTGLDQRSWFPSLLRERPLLTERVGVVAAHYQLGDGRLVLPDHDDDERE